MSSSSGHIRASADLLRDSVEGSEPALEELLTRHYNLVYGYLRLRVGPQLRAQESVADLVQSVCREVLLRADRFEYQGEAAFRAWFCEAALLKVRQRHEYWAAAKRDPKRVRDLRDTAGNPDLAQVYRSTMGPDARALETEELERLELAFEGLSEDQREALSLRCLCELDYAEVAARMGRSEAAIRQLVSRARVKLVMLMD